MDRLAGFFKTGKTIPIPIPNPNPPNPKINYTKLSDYHMIILRMTKK